MPTFLLSVYQPDGPIPAPDVLTKIMNDVDVLTQEMKSAGAWVFSAGLHPADAATVLRSEGGDVLTTDGPFLESKEHLGGFTIIAASDPDAALAWGRRMAQATTLPIEVRQVQGDPTP